MPTRAAGRGELGADRTYEQDPKYPIRLLVDIAIKALSPAINDPTTAVQALDQIEDLLRRLARHRARRRARWRTSDGVLRLVYPMPGWDDYLSLAFDEIRVFGATSVQVLRRMRSALRGIEEALGEDPRVAAVRALSRAHGRDDPRAPASTSRTAAAPARRTRRASGLARKEEG